MVMVECFRKWRIIMKGPFSQLPPQTNLRTSIPPLLAQTKKTATSCDRWRHQRLLKSLCWSDRRSNASNSLNREPT